MYNFLKNEFYVFVSPIFYISLFVGCLDLILALENLRQ